MKVNKWTGVKKKLPTIIISVLLLAGLGFLLYPSFSNWYNQKFHEVEINGYTETVTEWDEESISQLFAQAEKYNDMLTGKNIEDPFVPGSGSAFSDNYTSILDIYDGMMGYIEIPKIEVELPIFHGTSAEVLKKGIGHLEMTSFPIGGEGNHSVLTGHTGLPEAELFTNLVDLELEDIFFIKILNRALAYQVDQIKIVDSSLTIDLKPIPGEDYVTLATCTPYGINSHRLLVRGTRVPYTPENEEGDSSVISDDKDEFDCNLIIAVLVLCILTVIITVKAASDLANISF
ncbi:MAG: class C sortase [Lachnospiraceae bacterium]